MKTFDFRMTLNTFRHKAKHRNRVIWRVLCKANINRFLPANDREKEQGLILWQGTFLLKAGKNGLLNNNNKSGMLINQCAQSNSSRGAARLCVEYRAINKRRNQNQYWFGAPPLSSFWIYFTLLFIRTKMSLIMESSVLLFVLSLECHWSLSVLSLSKSLPLLRCCVHTGCH